MFPRVPFSCCLRGVVLAVLALFANGPRLPAAEKSENPIIELPTLTVTDSRPLPPPESWRYAAIPGYEILTNASERETRKLLRDFQLFNYAVDVVWEGLQEKRAVPIALIICGRGGKFDAFVPKENNKTDSGRIALFLKDREQAAIVLDFESKTIRLASVDLANAAAAPAVGADDAAGGPTTDYEVDHYRQLYREYLRFLLTRIEPRLPAWFEEGLAQLFMGMKVEPKRITFAQIADGFGGGASFNRDLQKTAFVPLQPFFAVPHDSEVADRPLGNRWATQAQGLVHMWIYGENQRYQKGLITFLRRLQKEPPTEKLFEECFKMNYKKMLLVFRGYVDFTNYKALEWRVPKGHKIPEPAPLVLREATQAEVGRIKGDAFRLAGHPEAAHAALIAPYIRGERDPRLLAMLGSEELAAGHGERAQKFFEAAVEGKVDRPRAYLELARLRAKVTPDGPDGNLSAAQTRQVLAPLLATRDQPPPIMPEVYELMADTLVRSEETPTREMLGILVNGVNLYPLRLGIAYQTARLCMRAGEFKGASALIDRGLAIAPDEKRKALFAELKDLLPPLPPPLKTPPDSTPAPVRPAKK